MFEWKNTYSCNVQEIDKQHQKMFELGSRIFDIASSREGLDYYDELMSIISELRDYTIYHFSYEEELMQRYEYEDLEAQSIEHHFFVKRLQKIERKDFDQMQKEAVIELITFVADWITNHILKSDMEYKDFFNKNGVY